MNAFDAMSRDFRVIDAAWLIPVLPLAGFVVLLLIGRRLGDRGVEIEFGYVDSWLSVEACDGSGEHRWRSVDGDEVFDGWK